MAFLVAVASSYLVACFMLAGISKACHYHAFTASVAAIVPSATRAAPILAATVIAGEACAALLLIVSFAELSIVLRQIAAVASLGIAAIFAGAIVSVLVLDREVSCNCFGEADSKIASESLISPTLIGLTSLASLLEVGWPQGTSTLLASGSAGIYLLLLHRASLLHFAASYKVRPL